MLKYGVKERAYGFNDLVAKFLLEDDARDYIKRCREERGAFADNYKYVLVRFRELSK